jgi:hypothetical protein
MGFRVSLVDLWILRIARARRGHERGTTMSRGQRGFEGLAGRRLAALSLGALWLYAGCSVSESGMPEPTARVEQAVSTCLCVPEGTCNTGEFALCTAPPPIINDCPICLRFHERCMVAANGDACEGKPPVEPPAGTVAQCYQGRCLPRMTECAGCWYTLLARPVCADPVSAKYCGNLGFPCMSCSDGNACTDDACVVDKATGNATCDYTNDNTNTCSDGRPCTDDVCVAGNCVGTADNTNLCTDGNLCTDDVCVAGNCVSTADNTNTCTGGICVAGACCTGCVNASGVCQPGTAAAACGTQGETCSACSTNVCLGAESCAAGDCVAGAPLVCDDLNPCTDDSCDPVEGCRHVPVLRDCSDGDPCTVGDSCDAAGLCVPGLGLDCSDRLPCATGVCLAGACQYAPANEGGNCDDGNDCTNNDACAGGECAGVGTDCDDGNPCTTDSCSLAAGCSYTPLEEGASCRNPQNVCLTGQTCQAGLCSGGQDLDCDDNNPCTVDICDRALGCAHSISSGEPCPGSGPCSQQGTCSPTGECLGNSMPKSCVPVDECHDAGACEPTTGICAAGAAKPDGASCSLGECRGGICTSTGTGGAGGGTGMAGESGLAGTGGEFVEGGAPAAVGGGAEIGGSQGGETAAEGGNEAGGTSASGGADQLGLGGTTGSGGGAVGGSPGVGGSSSGGPATDSGNTGTPSQSGGRSVSGASGSSTAPGAVFQREPGGCSCRAVSRAPTGTLGLTVAWLAALFVGTRRRRREGNPSQRV